MTAPHLTLEQRIAEAMCLDVHRPTWWDGMACTPCRDAAARIAPTVARMLADARAVGDRQGAARVAVSVETVLDEYGANDDQRATVIGELARDIRATLAQTAISEEGSQA